ncbi:hypothetical protein F511_32175 [Dorcoceras hygrometricum]|uniref:Uncharacterized protein n=1 Tax=Dorcoceras hygrometricum TaxID=472368 RepID=A0A2Z7D0E5_9LAMI|nr:hypothetical protein F511_32175 [Dorcoceras hygrometricum]
MSLFDLRDVCIVIGSLATLDIPMVVDLIGIYVLKGPYCMLTMTDWFLQALSVIPRGSWGDVARRFTMIRWSQDDVPVASCSGSTRELQCYCISSRHGIPDARKAEVAKCCNQAQSIQSSKTHLNGKNFVSNGLNSKRGLYTKATPLKQRDDCRLRSRAEVVRVVVAQKSKINRRQQQRENESEAKLSTIIRRESLIAVDS